MQTTQGCPAASLMLYRMIVRHKMRRVWEGFLGDAGYWLDLQALDLMFFSIEAKYKHCAGFKAYGLNPALNTVVSLMNSTLAF